MTITEYISTVPRNELFVVCCELVRDDKVNIEICIDRLLDRKTDLEEDMSHYSDLIPRLQKRFDEAIQNVELMLEYERMLDKDTI